MRGIKIGFTTRTAAREFVKAHGGKIKDSRQRPYLGKGWIVAL